MGEVIIYGSVLASLVHACLPCLTPEHRLLLLSRSPMQPLPEQQLRCSSPKEAEQSLQGEGWGRGSAGDEAEEVLQNCGEKQNLV